MNPRKTGKTNKHYYFKESKDKYKKWQGLKERIQKIKFKKLKYAV